MDTSTDITLQNKVVLLRPLSINDGTELESIALDPQLWAVSASEVRTSADLNLYVQSALADRRKGISYPFVIVDKRNSRIAGCTRFGNISPENKRLEIGWTWIGREFQGTGLNKACKYELFEYTFETLGWNRVELKTDALNQRSRHAMVKVGCTEEGTLRSHMITSSGRIRDTVYYSIIRPEWPGLKRQLFSEFTP